MTTLHAQHLAKAYKARKVVRDVSVSIDSGQVVGLLGPNGAGKTTCFYMIVGLVKADQGTVTVNGKDVTRLPMHGRAREGIGYLPQEASIFRGLSVEDNIRAVLEVTEPDKKKRESELTALLEEFHIDHLRKQASTSLSGGERQRAALARALILSPDVILADEPTGNVDWEMSQRLLKLLVELNKMGKTVMIATHDLSLIRAAKHHVQARVLRISGRKLQLAGADL